MRRNRKSGSSIGTILLLALAMACGIAALVLGLPLAIEGSRPVGRGR